MWTPNDFCISRDFFNRELINFQVGFVLRADSLWLDPLNKNTLLVTFSVSQQRYTRTTGTITLYISCVFAEEDGSWRKAAQSAAVPDSICPNLFHQASQPYQNQSLCAGVCDFYVPLWKMSGLLMTGSRASRNDFPRHVFHPFCRSNFIRTESSGCRSYRSGMGRTPCLSSKYWRYTRYTHIHNSAMPIIVLREKVTLKDINTTPKEPKSKWSCSRRQLCFHSAVFSVSETDCTHGMAFHPSHNAKSWLFTICMGETGRFTIQNW